VTDDVREMGMEHKGEISQGFSHDVLRAKYVKVGGKNSGYESFEMLNPYYKKPNYPGQGTAGLTKWSDLFKRGMWGRHSPLS
jgi:hypothetical protein